MITKIITHFRPHADELVSIMLLKKFPEGEKVFPGVSTASISFMTTGELPDGKTAKDFPDTVFLGCGGGEFDEHATSKKERVEGETCVTLVAKKLGLEKNPGLQKVLHFIKEEDLHGSKVKNEIPMIIKILHQHYKDDVEGIYNFTETSYMAEVEKETKHQTDKNFWARPTLENIFLLLKEQGKDAEGWREFAEKALQGKQDEFIRAKQEFAEKGRVEKFIAHDAKQLVLGVIESDNEEMNKYVRSIGAHVVVQFSKKGNVILMTDTKRGVNLTKAFVLLRMAEQHYRGGVKITDEALLSKEGFTEGIPYWYLFHTRAMGFNGSLTTIGIEPTKIPHDKVVELIKESLK